MSNYVSGKIYKPPKDFIDTIQFNDDIWLNGDDVIFSCKTRAFINIDIQLTKYLLFSGEELICFWNIDWDDTYFIQIMSLTGITHIKKFEYNGSYIHYNDGTIKKYGDTYEYDDIPYDDLVPYFLRKYKLEKITNKING